MKKTTTLIILDGLALNPNPKGNAVHHAKKKTLDALLSTYPHTQLENFGPSVGLPKGQMGNSEVGHLNIGAGRVVEQELLRINKAVEENRISNIDEFASICLKLKSSPTQALHLIGLVSTGGVHSELSHLLALIDGALALGVSHIYVHVITDGRDRPPTASLEEVKELVEHIKKAKTSYPDSEIAIASVIGRYFAMDRDKRWERTQKAFDLYCSGAQSTSTDVIKEIQSQHERGITDEFLEPVWLASNTKRSACIKDEDGIIFYNFRTDRMRQLLHAFLGEKIGFREISNVSKPTKIAIATMTEYEAGLPVEILFKPFHITNHLGQVLANASRTQMRIAETEKYPHVTYFFNGGDEKPCLYEERVMIPSPRDVATYDLKPEMSAEGVKDAVIDALRKKSFDVIVVNFANCDMVGHTGVFDAAVKAVETVDRCLGEILIEIEKQGGNALITADHGNADQMIDYETGKPHTFHTTYPVPFCLFGESLKNQTLRSGGALCDIAPTVLDILGIEQPKDMTGKSLIVKK